MDLLFGLNVYKYEVYQIDTLWRDEFDKTGINCTNSFLVDFLDLIYESYTPHQP